MPPGGDKYGAWFDRAAADAAVAFFPRYLRHTEGEWAGHPFVLSDWQRDRIIRPLFGWKRADGTRLIRTVYLEVPRKNGKTELAAGVSLIALLADGEFGGQVYSAAVDEEQAKLVFKKAGVMVGFAEELHREIDVFKTSIYCGALMASFRPLSSKPGGKHGFHPSGLIADEIHAWPDRELYQVVHDGMAGRRQPIEVLITTAGIHGEGFGWEMHDYAEKVLDGTIEDPTFLAVIFAAAANDDWTDEAVWAKANPNLGISPKLEFLRSQCAQAKESPRLENNFRRFHLNQWTEQTERWIPMERWDNACKAVRRELDGALAGRRCHGGLDLSAVTDLTGLGLIFPALPEDPWEWDLWCHFWMPEHGLDKRVKKDRVPYDKWAKAGFITLTEGNVVDHDAIRGFLTGEGESPPEGPAVVDLVDLAELAIDRWNAHQITTQLQGDGVTVVPFGQGFASMSAPSKEWEAQVLAGTLNHMGNPVLRWMMANAEIQTDPAGNIKPVKPDRRKSTARIDGVVASIMALGRATVDEGPVEIDYQPGQMFA